MPSEMTAQAGVATAPRAYDPTLQALHWLVVLFVLVQFGTKLVPVGEMGATETGLDNWHVAIGPTILLLMLIRLAWRLTHRVPPPPQDVGAPVRWASRLTHWLFYGLLIVMPILGWISASAFGVHPTLLGIVTLPTLTGSNKALAEQVGAVHGVLAWAVLALIVLHLGGVLFHGVIKRDGVVGRMVPGTE